jgi:uncharacterized protein YcbK (DUF882 family)
MKRRATLIGALAFLGLPPGHAAEGPGRGNGEITFYTYHLKESATVRYRDGDRSLPEGLKRIETIFRSRDSQTAMTVDPALLELIDRIEDHFGVRQVEVISGYRSTAFNRELKATGHAVANESYHTKAMAADLHLDEITEEALKEYAESLKAGGVGFYPSLHMVHVDIGPVRTWGEPAPRKSWVGEKNEAAPVTLTVTPDRTVGEKKLETLKVEGGEIEPELEIEFFDRGTWTRVGAIQKVALRADKAVFEELPWGKFRLKAKVKGRPNLYQYSNGFYFKRI